MNDTAVQRRASPLAALLALLCALVIALAPGAAWAADETELTSTGGELSSGSYILNEDVTLTTDITIPSGAEVTIDLAGHTLTGTGSGSVITVSGTLTLTDSGSDGTITGGKATNGGGVFVSDGTLTMEGGTISGNTASGNGAGVYVTNGFFTMNDGTVTNNTATVSGGGVAASSSTVTMNGGTISNNTGSTDTSVEGNGGGISVYSNSTLTMNGGLITGNEVRCGGGVYVGSGSTFTMNGGAITSNKGVYDSGGGVYATGSSSETGTTVTLNGGNISDNTAAWGAGVYLRKNVSFTMTGGAITNNTATPYSESVGAYGGGIHAYTTGCSVTISGGIISGNSATSAGGGIHMYQSTSFVMSGGTITGNSTDGTAGGVYIAKNATFEVTSASVVITGNKAGTNADDLYLAKSASSLSVTGIAGSWYRDPEALRYGSEGYDSDSNIITMTEISAGTVYPLHSEVSSSATITYDGNDSSVSPDSTGEDGTVTSGTFTQVVTSSSTLADKSVFWLDRCHCISSWNTAADGSGTSYNAEASAESIVSNGSDITLYAQWSESHDYDYDDIEWTWTEDTDGSWSATATVTCTRCGATKTIDATVTSETVDATCEEDGSTEYTASITAGETTYTCDETKTVTIDATGHDYDGGVVTVEAWDGAEGTITYTCANDSSHTYTETFLYYIEEGADQTIGRGEDLAVTSETDNTALGTAYEKFTGLQIDGADLDSSYYTFEEGSVAATISADYLDTLDTGEHELTFVYTDGSVSTTFTIEDEEEASEEEAAAEEESSDDDLAGTGDRTAFTVLSIATMGGIALVAGILAAKRRKA